MARPSPVLAALLLLIVADSPAQASKRPITHEDLWLMKRLSAPALSPDGRVAVLAVTEPTYDADAQAVDLWLVPTDGIAPPRQITFSREPESGPVFSPDGRRIAFSAQRAGDTAPQVYVLDLDGGEARRATAISTGARTPRFSPDGTRIAFVSSVFPGTADDADNRRIADERKARKHEARVYTGFPIRNWDRWLDDRQQRLFVVDAGGGEARDLLAGSALVASPGFGGRFTETGEEIDFTRTPESRALVFAATTNRDTAAYAWTHTDLYQVALAGGEPKRLTGSGGRESQDGWGRPDFGHDGRTLYAQRTPRTDRVYNATRLASFDWPSMRARAAIEPPLARAANFYAVAPDDRSVFFSAEDAGLERVFRARAGRSGVDTVTRGERGVYTGLAGPERGRELLVAVYESATEPQELVRIDVASGTHQRLTAFNAAQAAALDLQPVEHFWTTNERGDRVHHMLVRPAGFDATKKYPLFVLMHGGPHIMWRDQFFIRWNYHLLARGDYVLLLSNYRGSTGFGEAYAQSIQGDPLKGPADDINAGADEAIRRFAFLDGGRQCAGGASYGGHLANWMQATTTRYRCLVSHAGLVSLASQWGTSDTIYGREVTMGGPHWEGGKGWTEQDPLAYAAKFKTPVLVTIGERDYRVPLNNTIEYWSALQRMQVESRLIVFPNENHWILGGHNSRFFYDEVDAWLRRFLVGEAPAAAGR
ncbi:MAG: prolyl oligopeptidase family serine peptidase [Pseudomonadota bacterium]